MVAMIDHEEKQGDYKPSAVYDCGAHEQHYGRVRAYLGSLSITSKTFMLCVVFRTF